MYREVNNFDKTLTGSVSQRQDVQGNDDSRDEINRQAVLKYSHFIRIFHNPHAWLCNGLFHVYVIVSL